MKKMLTLLLALALLLCTALAENTEETVILPVEIVEQTEDVVSLSAALDAAKQSLAVVPAESLIRAKLVRMSDDSRLWIVTIFDVATFYADAWCITVDAASGAVVETVTTDIGYFTGIFETWLQAKGPMALWSLEDKQIWDALYSLNPSSGQPVEGDMSQGEALAKAIDALSLTNAVEYQIGYGYLMGSGENNGVWEVYFVQEGEVVYKVNLDAGTGEVYYIEPDEEGNG